MYYEQAVLERVFRRPFTDVEMAKLTLLLLGRKQIFGDSRKKKKQRRKFVMLAIAPEVR